MIKNTHIDCVENIKLKFRVLSSVAAAILSVATSGVAEPLQTEFSDMLKKVGPGTTISIASMNMASASIIGTAPADFWDRPNSDRLDDGEVTDEMLVDSFDEHLRDAQSARFKDVAALANKTAGGFSLHTVILVCGQVNAPNGMGGFTGYEPFVLQFDNPYFVETTSSAAAVGEDWIQPLCRSYGL